MTIQRAIVVYGLADLGFEPMPGGLTRVYSSTNIPGNIIADGASPDVLIGTGKGEWTGVDTGHIEVPVPGPDTIPTSWQTYIHVEGSDRNTGKQIARRFGPYTITGTHTRALGQLEAEQGIPPVFPTGVTAVDLLARAEAAGDVAARHATAADTAARAAYSLAGHGVHLTNPEALTSWRTRLSSADSEPVRVVTIGDSITEGTHPEQTFTQTWPQRVQKRLREYAGVSGGVGFVPAAPTSGTNVTRIPNARSGLFAEGGWGLAGRSMHLHEPDHHVTYAPQPCTRVRVWYGKASLLGGGLRVLIDDVDQDVVLSSLNPAANEDGFYWDSPELPAGEHTVKVVSAGGGLVGIHTGVTFFNGDYERGIRVYNGGRYGYTTADFVTENMGIGHWNMVRGVDPHLMIVWLGAGDIWHASTTAAGMLANIDKMIAEVSCPVLLVGGYLRGEHGEDAGRKRKWADYLNGLKARATGRVAYVDLAAQWPRLLPDASTNDGLLIDWAHPSNAGMERIADILTPALVPLIDIKGEPGAPGPRGLPGVNAVPAKEAVDAYAAELVDEEDSEFRGRLSASIDRTAKPLAHAAASAARGSVSPLARPQLVPVPARPAATVTDADWSILGISRDHTRLYGHSRTATNRLGYSDDDGQTWTQLRTFDGQVSSCRQMTNGELLVTTRTSGSGGPGQVHRSKDGQAGWDVVLTASANPVYFQHAWGISVEGGSMIVASEYGPTSSTFVKVSYDYADTWETLWTNPDDTDPTSHIHGCCYDRYDDIIWVTTGDAQFRRIMYTPRGPDGKFGHEWVVVTAGRRSPQMVGIIPLPHAVLFTSDSPPDGIVRIWRDTLGRNPEVEYAYTLNDTSVLTTLGAGHSITPDGTILMPFARITPGYASLLASRDGSDIHEVYRYPDPTGDAWGDGFTFWYGTASGKWVGSFKAAGGVWRMVTIDNPPTWHWREPRTLSPTARLFSTIQSPTGNRRGHVVADAPMPPVTDLDVRVEAAHDTWNATGTETLLSEFDANTNQRSWHLWLNGNRLRLWWYPEGTGTPRLQADSPVLGFAPGERVNLRVTLDTDNGSGGWTVVFYRMVGGTWEVIHTVTGSGATALPQVVPGAVVGGTNWGLSAGWPGRIYSAYFMDGIAGNVRGSVDFSRPQWRLGESDNWRPAPTGIDDQGNVWGLGYYGGSSGDQARIYGEPDFTAGPSVIPPQVPDAAEVTAADLRAALVRLGLIT